MARTTRSLAPTMERSIRLCSQRLGDGQRAANGIPDPGIAEVGYPWPAGGLLETAGGEMGRPRAARSSRWHRRGSAGALAAARTANGIHAVPQSGNRSAPQTHFHTDTSLRSIPPAARCLRPWLRDPRRHRRHCPSDLRRIASRRRSAAFRAPGWRCGGPRYRRQCVQQGEISHGELGIAGATMTGSQPQRGRYVTYFRVRCTPMPPTAGSNTSRPGRGGSTHLLRVCCDSRTLHAPIGADIAADCSGPRRSRVTRARAFGLLRRLVSGHGTAGPLSRDRSRGMLGHDPIQHVGQLAGQVDHGRSGRRIGGAGCRRVVEKPSSASATLSGSTSADRPTGSELDESTPFTGRHHRQDGPVESPGTRAASRPRTSRCPLGGHSAAAGHLPRPCGPGPRGAARSLQS